MAKRSYERAIPPPPKGGFEIRLYGSKAKEGWEQLTRTAADELRAAFILLETNPAPAERTKRHYRLRDELARVEIEGQVFDQWQYKVTAAGRIWYAVDKKKCVVWVTRASHTHPPETER